MATNPLAIGDEQPKDTDDDFVILEKFENMTNSGASTIPEKQTYESLEKQSDSFSSLGDSRINEQPYYESSRFIDEQLDMEKKQSLLGEGDEGEKSDECNEKSGSEFGSDKGEGYGISSSNVGVEGTKMDSSEVDVKGNWMYVLGGSHEGVTEKDKHGLVGTEMKLSREETEMNSGEGGTLVRGNGQTTVSEGHSHARGETPVITSPPSQENDAALPADRTTEVRESSESSQSLDDNVSENSKQNFNVVSNETSTHMTGFKIGSLGSVHQSQPSETDVPVLPNEAKQDLAVQQGDANKGSSGFDQSQASEAIQDVPSLPNQAEQSPAKTQSNEGKRDVPSLPEQAKQNPAQMQANESKPDVPSLPNQAEQNPTEMQPNEGKRDVPSFLNQAKQNPAQIQSNEGKRDVPSSPNQAKQNPAQMRANESTRDAPSLPNQAEQNPAETLSNESKRDAPSLPNQAEEGRAQMQANEAVQDVVMLPNQAELDPAQMQPQQAEQRGPVNAQPIVHNQRGSCCSLLYFFAILVPFLAFFYMIKNPKPLPFKPVIEINTKTHVSPTERSWQLMAKCMAYNSSFTVTYCQWKQIHPLPTSPENTVLPKGTKDCPSSSSNSDIDATLHDLNVPTDLGTYTFELACGHDSDNPATKRVEIWVNELIPPIISIANYQVIMCTSIGTTKLEASCQALQGRLVERKWEYIDGPSEYDIKPSQDGMVVGLSKPGIYKFKYRCTDSFGGTTLSSVITVTAKPPYVLGIDLGTSTTCIALIKEDGTRQDIGIYDDESDTDPCMPSIVSFALNGELLVGEKALRQAVVNPQATIYEVKRLMGRSYYDDANHKFAYRVRPTLKSHSLKGVRAAIEIPCGKGRTKLVQPELVSALILRHVADYAQKYLKVVVKDVVISVPAQFDDAQRKATMDAGLIAGLNPIKIVNEPTVAAFAANRLTEKLLAASETVDSAADEKDRSTVWAVVADIGGGTTDYALMQIQGFYYKVITTDGDKTLGGRDIDIQLATVMTDVLEDKYPGLDLTNLTFRQKLRIECENAKIVLSEKEQYSLTIEYEDEQVGKLPLEYLLTRVEFEEHISGILKAMVKPLDSLLARSGGLSPANIEDLYLVGGTSHIPKLKELLLNYFSNVKNIRHEDPVQLVSRGAAAFGAALTGLVQVAKMPRIDAVPLPINIAVDMDDMLVIFERNRLYPCIEKKTLTTFTNNQNAIVIKVYEGEGRTADECHFLGEFDLSGIPPLPKNVPEIEATFKIDTNGILSVKASYGDMVKGMKLDVYSKSGGMIDKTRQKMTLALHRLMSQNSKSQPKCDVLEDATPMSVIPVKPKKSNVLKLSVDSEYDSVQMANSSDPNAAIPTIGMVAVKGLVTDYDSLMKTTDLDIVLVVDTSGSMEGVPILTMKNAMLHLIDLLEENHRLGIVTYATHVYRNWELVSCTERNKRNARNIVNSLGTLGSTNLYGGLLSGLEMAYDGGRRSRVLLFTDGYANDGLWTENEDIIRGIVRETTALASRSQAQVTLSTFGYLGDHDESLLQDLATNVGGGGYNFLNENTALGSAFGQVLGDAIHTVAEKIQLSITPFDKVQILEAITHFNVGKKAETLTFDIPSTADQQSRHVLLRLAVPPTREQAVHEGLFRVELTYTNTLTEREEGSEEYLFVARTAKLDLESRSRDVDEQLNRVFVARQMEEALEALKSVNREKAVELLEEALTKTQDSDSRSHTLSVCLSKDLEKLIHEVVEGDLNTAKKSLQDSLTSHWQEKGGRSACYVTRREDKLITIFTS